MARIWFHPIIKFIKREWVLTSLFNSGKSLGLFDGIYEYNANSNSVIGKDDLFVHWNRHLNQDIIAKRFERIGAKTLLLENPYASIPDSTDKWVSIGKGFHNNPRFGINCLDSGERLEESGLVFKPWKQQKETPRNILICTQSKVFNGEGLGYELNKQPYGWDSMILNRLSSQFPNANLIFRTHPNQGLTNRGKENLSKKVKLEYGSDCSLMDSLEQNDIDLTVVHASNSAIESLLNGIPVYYTSPSLILSELCSNELKNLKTGIDRRKSFERLVWNQLSKTDIDKHLFFDIIYKTF